MPKPIIIYALGEGWGHLNRAIALGRVAARQYPVIILTNSPYAGAIAVTLASSPSPFSLELRQLPQTSLQARQYWIQQQCQQPAIGLIVDTFPRGLTGELTTILPRLSIPKILVHRDLNPHYIKVKQADIWAAQYDPILIPGEGNDLPFACFPQTIHTPPWLVRNCQELLPIHLASSRLKVTRTSPLAIVCATGKTSEQAFFGRITKHLAASLPPYQVRCLASNCPPECPPSLWFSHYPALDYLQLASAVISGGGYNIVHECRLLGVPLLAFPFERSYDRQALRIQKFAHHLKTESEAVTRVQRRVTYPFSPDTPPEYINGVDQAWESIKRSFNPST